jgi:signal transduction histidine kinase
MSANPPPATLGKQLDYLFATAGVGALAHAIVGLMTWAVLFYGAELKHPFILHVMLALMAAASLAMLGLTRRYRRLSEPDMALLQGFADAHAVVVLYGALVWGISAFLVFDQSVEVRAFYTLAWAGVSMGAVSSQHSSLRSCLISIWGSNPLVAAMFAFSTPGVAGNAIAAMIVTFGVLLSLLALRNNRFVRENLALNQTLSTQLLELEELSHRLGYAQQKAEASERAKSRLLAQASHDFRQPVHAIGIMAECLRDSLEKPENLDMVKRIEASVEALSGMFRSFLDFYALEAGRMRPEPRAVAVDVVLGDIRRDADEWMRTGDEVSVRVLGNRAWIHTDPVMLTVMLRNLVTNAMKYGGGGVLVGCRRRDGQLAIEVYDNGPGLSEAEQLEIFDEFVRVVDQARPSRDGIGLGLSITQRMAELLGLHVRIRSRMGHGSCFSIEGLPLVEGAAHAPPAEDWSEAPRRELSVQLIEDDETTRAALTELLQRWGYAVHIVPREAAQQLAPHGILVVDQDQASAQPGLDIVRAWRQAGGQCGVLTSGSVDPGLRAACAQAGIQLLLKPVAPSQLRSVLLSFDRRA